MEEREGRNASEMQAEEKERHKSDGRGGVAAVAELVVAAMALVPGHRQGIASSFVTRIA